MSARLIAVCVPTCQRPTLLRACLLSLGKLQVPEGYQLQIIVVDNDLHETAKQICTELKSLIVFPLHYVVQAERGLSSVRNRLLEEALQKNADLLAFIDDDEQCSPAWLVQHTENMLKYKADVSTGPVRAITSSASSGKPKPTGSMPRHVSTNNVLLKTKLISAQGLRFDPFYNFIGGEDFDFFERSAQLGSVHIWVEEALVFETIPSQRDSIPYLIYRHYSGGITNIKRYRREQPAWRAWLRYSPKIIAKLAGAMLYVFIGVIKMNKADIHKAVKKLANGFGYLAGLFNVSVERYRNIDGDEIMAEPNHFKPE